MKLPYDKSDKDSVIRYAQKLVGKNLQLACYANITSHTMSGKGSFGQLVEKYYFLYEPNNKPEPDFEEAGLELKCTPLKTLKNGSVRAKERLVLNMIDYSGIVKEDFEKSQFWKKNKRLLLVMYLYEPQKSLLEYEVKAVSEWEFPEEDKKVIRNDWRYISQKVREGKAHELSEGDTFYLGACTKGAKGENLRDQPNNDQKAKQRAFSLKQGYLNYVIARISGGEFGNEVKLIHKDAKTVDFNIKDIVLNRFKKYIGKSTSQIEEELGISINNKAKSYYSSLTKLILGVAPEKEIEEFEKAEITVKTIRLGDDDLPKEEISFPSFKYEEIVNETWEDSTFYEVLSKKFLFVFFKYENGDLILRKARFWNMPFSDRNEAQKVWMETQEIVRQGRIVKSVKNEIRKTNFPGKSFNKIAHVRPHARDSNDTYPLPNKDKLTGLTDYTKYCFWLNRDYVKDNIYYKP